MRISVHPLFFLSNMRFYLITCNLFAGFYLTFTIKSGKCEINAILSTDYVKI